MALWSGLILAGLLASGCEDPACVFGAGGCQQAGAGSADGIGELAAGVPSNGDLILDPAPFVASSFPRDSRGTPGSVITLVMSESLDPDSLLAGFELVDVVSGGPIPILQPPLLTGGGRVVVLVPAAGLQPGQSVRVQSTEDSLVADLTGQALSSGGTSLAEFSVAAAPTSPDVVTVFPGDDSIDQSELSEIVVVFDRPMDASTFTDASFDVSVDQNPPAIDPVPRFLRIPGPTVIPVTQVWTWRGLGADGDPVSVGQTADVELILSANGNELLDDAGEVLATETFQFRTAAIGAPTLVAKAAVSLPADAIGMPNLSSGMPVLEATLATPGLTGDQLGVFLIGATTDRQAALLRRVAISDGSMTVDVLGDDLNLLTGGGEGLFLSGDMHIAVRHERGAVGSALRLLDVDSSLVGNQPLIFDVTPPGLTGFGPAGESTVEVRSDMRGLVVVGRADDEVREVEVITASLGDTGLTLDVVGSTPDGLFIARPVSDPMPLDIIDPADLPQAFDIRLFDRAMNASASMTGSFVQTGVVGGGLSLPGPRVLVDVFDANTLLPIEGALVMTQQDLGASSVTDRTAVTSDASGHAEPLSAATGETILIVDAAGYDLFTFHGVATQRIQVPLVLSALATAVMVGNVIGDPGSTFASDSTGVTDSRRLPIIERVVPTQTCTGDVANGLFCTFGPGIIQPLLLGAQAFMATNDGLTQANFSALAFLRAFDLRLPAPQASPGQMEAAIFRPPLLGNLEPEELPIAIDSRTLSISAAVNLGALDGAPRISIEGIAHGLPDSVPVGKGLALDDGLGGFDVVGAYAGIAHGASAPLGELVGRGSIEPDLVVQVEVVDTNDNRLGRRIRLPDWAATMTDVEIPDVPALLSPGPGAGSGVPPYDLSVRNVIEDASSQGGLYHVILTDSTGRDWHLWRPDPPDAAGDVRIHVSDLSGFSTTGLTDGSIVAQVSVHAWPSFSINSFLWTDIDRIQDQFGHAAATTYLQP